MIVRPLGAKVRWGCCMPCLLAIVVVVVVAMVVVGVVVARDDTRP